MRYQYILLIIFTIGLLVNGSITNDVQPEGMCFLYYLYLLNFH